MTTDANGYEIDTSNRGLRVCDHCKQLMSEGFVDATGSGYACSSECMAADPQWVIEPDEHAKALGLPLLPNGLVHITTDLIGLWLDDELDDGPDCCVFWTDWEGAETSEEALTLLSAS